jgi:hypothetical protein
LGIVTGSRAGAQAAAERSAPPLGGGASTERASTRRSEPLTPAQCPYTLPSGIECGLTHSGLMSFLRPSHYAASRSGAASDVKYAVSGVLPP